MRAANHQTRLTMNIITLKVAANIEAFFKMTSTAKENNLISQM